MEGDQVRCDLLTQQGISQKWVEQTEKMRTQERCVLQPATQCGTAGHSLPRKKQVCFSLKTQITFKGDCLGAGRTGSGVKGLIRDSLMRFK